MSRTTLAIKVDVDTERGTRLGVQALIDLFKRENIPATFLFSLGPDHTGRAIKRIFRKGFLKKVGRTSVLSTYGFRTLLNGVLLPGPHIGKKHAALLRQFKAAGDFEMGIHCYDHVYWQDHLFELSLEAVSQEFEKAADVFQTVFGENARSAGSAGWQANAYSLQVYDEAKLGYGSDTRGTHPFVPAVAGKIYHTLQLPTTLPTLDELLGRPEYPHSELISHYVRTIKAQQLNVLTIHAEMEGMKHFDWFNALIASLKREIPDLAFERLDRIADTLRQNQSLLPICEMIQGSIDGRSGTLALQGQSQ